MSYVGRTGTRRGPATVIVIGAMIIVGMVAGCGRNDDAGQNGGASSAVGSSRSPDAVAAPSGDSRSGDSRSGDSRSGDSRSGDSRSGDSPGARLLEHPHALFFRTPEAWSVTAGIDFARWSASFSRLDGVVAKTFGELRAERSESNLDWLTRFAAEHPEQLALLHFSGVNRDPQFETEPFFTGHWLFLEGCRTTTAVTATSARTVIGVENPALFKVDTGYFRDRDEPLGLCRVDAQGRPDWTFAETVVVREVDREAGTITVDRGAHGSRPLDLPAGSHVAAFATNGPFEKGARLTWTYNLATTCPRDAAGRNCAEVLAAQLGGWLGPTGVLADFDGIELDVSIFTMSGWIGGGRTVDVDADGVGDDGIVDGVDVYGVGVYRFHELLRRELGDDAILIADGTKARSQRSMAFLNGIETEGWPSPIDAEIELWSSGFNRQRYWNLHGRRPTLSYIVHKDATGHLRVPDDWQATTCPPSITRLIMAVSAMTGSAFSYLIQPERSDSRELVPVWDELVGGTRQQRGWLGRAKGPAHELARQHEDLVAAGGAGAPAATGGAGRALSRDRLIGENVVLRQIADGVSVGPRERRARRILTFELDRLDVPGGDLLVTADLSAEAMRGYPRDVPRLLRATLRSHRSLVRPATGELRVIMKNGNTRAPRSGGRRAAGDGTVRFDGRVSIRGDVREAYLIVVPDGSTDAARIAWERDIDVGAKTVLTLSTGSLRLPSPGDGVRFRVVLEDGEREVIMLDELQTEPGWVDHRVALDAFADRTVRVRFETDAGPAGDATGDYALWGDVYVSAGTAPRAFPTLESFVGVKRFESTFYFRDLEPGPYDVVFHVEGDEPLFVHGIRAHACADAMVREFDHGIVLVNPSRRPYEFDLGTLFPGARFRRLEATRNQDPAVNDGSPVGERVVLNGRDALFLERQSAD